MTTIKKRFILLIVAVILLILYIPFKKYIKIDIELIFNQINKQCLIRTTKFLNALNKQKLGIVMIRNNKTNITDYDATIKNMPVHFNNIWGEHYNDLKPVGLQADSAEKKYFLKFRNSTSNTECNVVTLGVGQTVEAELELKQIYPQCKFLALDPVSEVNEDLVESKLNGTFVKKVITAEDSYTAYAGPVSIWNSEGKSEFNQSFSELSIGFFDFFLYYNAESVIDLLTIDVEGSEFPIFQLLAEQYDQLPVIICQINIEFHHVHYNANSFLRNRFFRNFNSFIRNDRFVVMKSDVHDVNYYPVFFVNYADKVCIEKFLC
uniref:Methyltransferase FkbM domain-containing protein n=1 Tax=Meloidogyne enterolobii TaxID=390850 RepID=A0A6V7X7P6_MELEN|nr:unnamed protein product [Meloidogyne enterolobii]